MISTHSTILEVLLYIEFRTCITGDARRGFQCKIKLPHGWVSRSDSKGIGFEESRPASLRDPLRSVNRENSYPVPIDEL